MATPYNVCYAKTKEEGRGPLKQWNEIDQTMNSTSL